MGLQLRSAEHLWRSILKYFLIIWQLQPLDSVAILALTSVLRGGLPKLCLLYGQQVFTQTPILRRCWLWLCNMVWAPDMRSLHSVAEDMYLQLSAACMYMTSYPVAATENRPCICQSLIDTARDMDSGHTVAVVSPVNNDRGTCVQMGNNRYIFCSSSSNFRCSFRPYSYHRFITHTHFRRPNSVIFFLNISFSQYIGIALHQTPRVAADLSIATGFFIIRPIYGRTY